MYVYGASLRQQEERKNVWHGPIANVKSLDKDFLSWGTWQPGGGRKTLFMKAVDRNCFAFFRNTFYGKEFHVCNINCKLYRQSYMACNPLIYYFK